MIAFAGQGNATATSARWAILAVVVVSLGGCLNPLRERETILPGERRALVAEQSLIEQQISNGTASIGDSSGGDWSQPGGNASNNPGHRSFATPVTRTFRSGLPGRSGKLRVAARPILSGGRIHVYRPNGSVVALGANGGRAWEVSLRPEWERQSAQGGGVATDGQTVFAATGYGQLAALSIGNGSVLWIKDLPAPARSAPTVSGGTVYVVTQDSEIFALSASDGTELWRNQGIPENSGVLGASSPAVAGGKVVVPYSSGEVIAFDAKSGEIEWVDALSTGNRIMAISGLSDVSASPVVANGVVYATGVSGRTIAVRLSNGERIWEENIGSPYTPMVSGNALFMVDINDGMTALNVKTGEPLWRVKLPTGKREKDPLSWVGPVLAGGSLYAASGEGDLIQLDPATGRTLGTTPIGDDIAVPPIVANGQMVMVSTKDAVIGFK